MATDKPLVSILMAVYKPNEKWLREQLTSLNDQTYPNIELVIYDDCPDVPFDESIAAQLITAFPYRVIRGEKNMGSNFAFQQLTTEGKGKYFSYCDQDDVWHSDKVELMVQRLEETSATLVCCDLAIIDGEGKRLADSITKFRKRHIFFDGDGLAPYLLVKNFIAGCAMIIRADIARNAVPFVSSLVHDQWLAINAALNGRIEVIRQPLLDYRQHSNNQTAVLQGVFTKQDYFCQRLENMEKRIADYNVRLSEHPELKSALEDLAEFNAARIRYFKDHRSGDLKIMRKHRHILKQAVLLESVMPFIPEPIMKLIFKIIRKGYI